MIQIYLSAFFLLLSFFSCEWKREVDLTHLPPLPRGDSLAQMKRLQEKETFIPLEKKKRYRSFFLKELFEVVLLREISLEEKELWLGILDQGGSREGIYRGFVLGRAYARLEEKKVPLGQKAMLFTQSFYDRYFGRILKEKDLAEINFYSMKRIVVERVLELIDAFLVNSQEDLYRWYAIVSAELAKSYGSAFKLEMRKKTNREWHWHWARGVPKDYLKSELIIKLHRVYHFIGPHPQL